MRANGVASSDRDPPSRIISLTIRPVAGALQIPHEAWAVARYAPGTSGTGPISGIPSTVSGR